ncbi:hypothetical protein E1A91_A09G088800v1, partial [Gossypium mustelinum]
FIQSGHCAHRPSEAFSWSLQPSPIRYLNLKLQDMRMPLLQMESEHYCEESILIQVFLPSNSKPPDQTLTESLYY